MVAGSFVFSSVVIAAVGSGVYTVVAIVDEVTGTVVDEGVAELDTIC